MSADIVARFKVSKTMNIVGIGFIVAGEIMEGSINIGNSIRSYDHKTYQIDAVEAIDYVSAQRSDTALILEPLDDNSTLPLLSLQLGQIIEVITNKKA